MKPYDHQKIESRWQKQWQKEKIYKTPDSLKGKDNEYILVEFAYPSGNLHAGHWYAYAVPDIYARFRRMQGKNVLFPFGFDAFGLPAENAAIKNKLNPKDWTFSNIESMREQLATTGISFDWSREVTTASPDYYKWTQWLFLRLFEKGLAYQSETPVNWCPSCKTVLANEQVIAGRCERCNTEVEQRLMKQWQLRITNYADRLIDDLDKLDWPESIKTAQKNWIGRSEGTEIDFSISKKYKYVLLHGFEGKPSDGKYSWLKKELEKRGHEVIAPILPNTNNPSEDEQVETALNATVYDENTILYGHSLGSVVAMKVLEKLNKPIASLILSGAFCDSNFKDNWQAPFEKTFKWNFDIKKIKGNTAFIKIVHDINDDGVTDEQCQRLEKMLGVTAKRVKAEKHHFDADVEPELLNALSQKIKIFTTRPDTIFGATYLVLSPEHEAILNLKSKILNLDDVEKYIKKAKGKTELQRQENKEKTGVEIKGLMAINPANKEEIPIWIADYVLPHYGTGAIMAVPADDERDEEFAKKFNLPIVKDYKRAGFESFGKKVIKYKLRDWVVSRQRYWGCPIPVIHCSNCGVVSVPIQDLPVVLPDIKDYLPDNSGKSPLSKVKKWVNVKCPKCGGNVERETDTLDTFIDSSWYFLRYCDPHNDKKPFDKLRVKNWMPVNFYSGGAEHTNMHLLYSRFFYKALFDLGLVNESEPYIKRMNRGLILGPDGQKMSKSRGNVVDPDDYVKRLGADTVRTYLAFIGPYNEVGAYPWSPDSIIGVRRFLEKVWKIGEAVKEFESKKNKSHAKVNKQLHRTIKDVTEIIEKFKFNTAVPALMKFINISIEFYTDKDDFETFLKLLAPFAPHITEEIWHNLGNKKSIHLERWPEYDSKKIQEEFAVIVVQINGKIRATLNIENNLEEKEVLSLALDLHDVKKWTIDKKIIKIIYVKNRLINIVI